MHISIFVLIDELIKIEKLPVDHNTFYDMSEDVASNCDDEEHFICRQPKTDSYVKIHKALLFQLKYL